MKKKGKKLQEFYALFCFKKNQNSLTVFFFCRRAINKSTKEFHALGIVSLFPSLKDPYSKKGYVSLFSLLCTYVKRKCLCPRDTTNACLFLTKVFLFFQEHFYDFQSNTGFLEWRVKTVQRKFRTSSTPHKKVQLRGGPTSPRVSGTSDDQRTGDECMEAISLLQHTTNCDVVFQKMRETFQYRRQILQDPQISADVLKIFPRFLDVKGLVSINSKYYLKKKIHRSQLHHIDIIFSCSLDLARLLANVWSRSCFKTPWKVEHKF